MGLRETWQARHRLVLTTMGVLLAAALTPPARAGAEQVFGPRDYARTSGSPNVFPETFSVCAPGRPYRLRVEIGVAGTTPVNSVSIAVNGSEVVKPSDFGQQAVVERPVALLLDNALTVTLGGKKRGTVRVGISTVTPCAYDLTIQEPLPGPPVPTGLLVTRGRVTGAGEIGVTVNGEVAARDGDTFTAVVPVMPGVTELMVVASAPGGPVLARRQALAVTPGPPPALQLVATPAIGPAPLTVTFSLATSAAVTHVDLDLEDDGILEHTGAVPPEGLRFAYPRPGVYLARARVTDYDGGRPEGRTLVQVLDGVAVDQIARARWAELRDALARGDVDGAAAVFSSRSRDTFRGQFQLLAGVGALAAVEAELGDLRLVAVRPGAIEYDLRVARGGAQESIWVLFELDQDGIWRLVTF